MVGKLLFGADSPPGLVVESDEGRGNELLQAPATRDPSTILESIVRLMQNSVSIHVFEVVVTDGRAAKPPKRISLLLSPNCANKNRPASKSVVDIFRGSSTEYIPLDCAGPLTATPPFARSWPETSAIPLRDRPSEMGTLGQQWKLSSCSFPEGYPRNPESFSAVCPWPSR